MARCGVREDGKAIFEPPGGCPNSSSFRAKVNRSRLAPVESLVYH
jgi:hypothetical protein